MFHFRSFELRTPPEGDSSATRVVSSQPSTDRRHAQSGAQELGFVPAHNAVSEFVSTETVFAERTPESLSKPINHLKIASSTQPILATWRQNQASISCQVCIPVYVFPTCGLRLVVLVDPHIGKASQQRPFATLSILLSD